MEKIGNALKRHRKKQKRTQSWVAYHMQVKTRQVQRWEAGTQTPDIERLAQLAKLLRFQLWSILVDIEDFVEVPIDPPKNTVRIKANSKKAEKKQSLAISWLRLKKTCGDDL